MSTDNEKRDLAFKYVMGTLTRQEGWAIVHDMEEHLKTRAFFEVSADDIVEDLEEVYVDTPEFREAVWRGIIEAHSCWDNGDERTRMTDDVIRHIQKHYPDALVRRDDGDFTPFTLPHHPLVKD